MMNRYLLNFVALSLAVSLTACGGGAGGGIELASSGGSGGGIGGTGLTSSGTIDGFGSVFVNGVEFETGGAEILVNGRRVGEDALGIGMVVLVVGEVNADGETGTAARIVFDEAVRGPVRAIARDQDGDSMLLDVLGVKVIVERTGTVFRGTGFDRILPGDLVEVSGFLNAEGRLRATRIEKKAEFLADESEIQLEGIVAELNGTQFSLGIYSVDASGADLSDIPPPGLADGLPVEVTGTLDPASAAITAARVELRESVEEALQPNAETAVQGLVSSFAGNSSFRVNGVAVDASAASVNPAGLVLANGVLVEVEGKWEAGVLRARRLEGRRGRVEIEAMVAAVDAASKVLTLQYAGGTVAVRLDSRTMLEDDTGRVDPLGLADIGIGDFLEIEAIRLGDSLIATRVDRDEADDEVLQAPLQGFVAGGNITLLGITFETAGAEFETEDDISLSAQQFYDRLQVGLLVKVKDRHPADGIADEVEFEFEGVLDGDREFDDDDFDFDDERSDDDESDETDEADEPDEEDEADEPDEEDESDEEDEADEPDEP